LFFREDFVGNLYRFRELRLVSQSPLSLCPLRPLWLFYFGCGSAALCSFTEGIRFFLLETLSLWHPEHFADIIRQLNRLAILERKEITSVGVNQNSKKEFELFVPGRLCLFGEHSDWAGGYRRIDSTGHRGFCLLCGTDQGIYAKVKGHPTELVMTSTLPDGREIGPHAIEMNLNSLVETARAGGFHSYCAGVAYHILKDFNVGGVEISNHKMDLPIRKGLSSSAAINVLTARSFNRIYDLKLGIEDEMEYAYLGEILTPSRCGRMDQACAYGRTPVFLTFDGDLMEAEQLKPQKRICVLIVDLKAGKNTKKILADLHSSFQSHKKVGEDVRYALGPVNEEILHQARKAVSDGDAQEIGRLMVEAQRLFDEFVQPACPEELRSPKLHRVLSYGPAQELAWGGKGVGSQGDGCAQFVTKGEAERDQLVHVLKALDVSCFPLTIEPYREPSEKEQE